MNEEIITVINGHKGTFFLDIDGQHEALMNFVYAGDDKIIIEHTEVFPGNEGKGLGKRLVAHAVAFAREKSIQIIPLCPFTKAILKRTPEYDDVWQH